MLCFSSARSKRSCRLNIAVLIYVFQEVLVLYCCQTHTSSSAAKQKRNIRFLLNLDIKLGACSHMQCCMSIDALAVKQAHKTYM